MLCSFIHDLFTVIYGTSKANDNDITKIKGRTSFYPTLMSDTLNTKSKVCHLLNTSKVQTLHSITDKEQVN